ncbi:MAG: dTDP-4-dehydrorhamnose reductase [Comamonas sp.]
MKLLLLGCNGQVGWELQRSLSVLGEVIAIGRDHPTLCGDFANQEGVVATVRAVAPNVIVNAAAHTAVDKAESEPELAHMLNASTPGVLAREARALNALLVHYSTDYVFDGCGDTPRSETAAVAPLSVYGKTKLEGEQAIQASGCQYLVFRTSWVYAGRGGNFAKTMLRLAQERDNLSVINDQWGAPTGADLIADITAHAIRQTLTDPKSAGLYHLAASGETTWHAYAQYLIAQAKLLNPDIAWKVQSINAVPASAFPSLAKRPHNSRLDTCKLQTTFGLQLPHWKTGVSRMLREIL